MEGHAEGSSPGTPLLLLLIPQSCFFASPPPLTESVQILPAANPLAAAKVRYQPRLSRLSPGDSKLKLVIRKKTPVKLETVTYQYITLSSDKAKETKRMETSRIDPVSWLAKLPAGLCSQN